MQILVGADPELFVENNKGQLVCAHGMVKGTKSNPFLVKGGAVQVDGMALEFNIDPAANMEEFIRNITLVKQTLHELIGIKEYNLLPSPSVFFPLEVMMRAHPFAKVLGCDPDYNAWEEGQANFPPSPETNMRTGAGHIHIGWGDNINIEEDEQHYLNCIGLTKQLDCSVGIQSLSWDDDVDRRKMYGKAGAFRPKTYGVEYRVLSNAWLKSEDLMRHVYYLVVKSTKDFFGGLLYYEELDAPSIINSFDYESAVQASIKLEKDFGFEGLRY